MSGLIRGLTCALFLLPTIFLIVPLKEPRAAPIAIMGLLILATYGWIWFYMRPSRFVLTDDGLEVVWPLRRRFIPRSDIIGADETSHAKLREEFGLLLRVGAGGLWGGFGLAWSSKGKHLGLYVSRHADGLVLVRCRESRSLLITPEDPHRFVRAVRRVLEA